MGLLRKLCDQDFLDFVSHYDILLLNETWISDQEQFNLDTEGYTGEHIYER